MILTCYLAFIIMLWFQKGNTCPLIRREIVIEWLFGQCLARFESIIIVVLTERPKTTDTTRAPGNASILKYKSLGQHVLLEEMCITIRHWSTAKRFGRERQSRQELILELHEVWSFIAGPESRSVIQTLYGLNRAVVRAQNVLLGYTEGYFAAIALHMKFPKS